MKSLICSLGQKNSNPIDILKLDTARTYFARIPMGSSYSENACKYRAQSMHYQGRFEDAVKAYEQCKSTYQRQEYGIRMDQRFWENYLTLKLLREFKQYEGKMENYLTKDTLSQENHYWNWGGSLRIPLPYELTLRLRYENTLKRSNIPLYQYDRWSADGSLEWKLKW